MWDDPPQLEYWNGRSAMTLSSGRTCSGLVMGILAKHSSFVLSLIDHAWLEVPHLTA